MDIEHYLYDSSRQMAVETAGLASRDKELFDACFDMAFEGIDKLSARAARVVCLCAELNVDWVIERIDEILERLPKINNESIQGTFLKVFQIIDLGLVKEKLGILAGICFDLIDKRMERKAAKVYAIEILYKVSQYEPELKNELMLIIETLSEYESPAFQSRGAQILKKLYKEI